MLDRLKPLPTEHGFPAGSTFYVFQEVIDQNDGAIKVDEYYDTGKEYDDFGGLGHRKNGCRLVHIRLRHRVPLLLQNRLGRPELSAV